MTGPKCYRCGDNINAHQYGDAQCSAAGCDCGRYVWPDSIQAAGHDLNRALSDLWREISAPFVRLLDRIARRLS